MDLINQDALSDLIDSLVDKRVEDQLSRFRALWEAERGDRLVSREDAANRLNVSVGTLDKLRERCRIKAVVVNRLVKYRETELLRFMGCK